ncbi:hypothetical protein [Flavobacterium sp.]|uniref:hypothetical protein n=1 Tax=Flavobacterium sp. TaxID=239 RepID=UPI0025E4AED3|nr:hypothetical protein [Flavobacterium sp.]
MALDRIEKLVEKYFEAATSIAEEKELKDYFASSNVAPQLEEYKPIFKYVVQAKKERFLSTLPLKANKSKRLIWLSSVASVTVLLGVSVFTFNNYQHQKSVDTGTINDPEIAFRETQKALAMISEHVNKGIGSMNYINEYEQSKNKIFK